MVKVGDKLVCILTVGGFTCGKKYKITKVYNDLRWSGACISVSRGLTIDDYANFTVNEYNGESYRKWFKDDIQKIRRDKINQLKNG